MSQQHEKKTRKNVRIRELIFEPPLMYNFVAGGISGTLSDALLHPLDTLKTRMQGQLTSKSTKYSGMRVSTLLILKEEGIAGLLGGFNASILGSLFGQSLYFGCYELAKRKLIGQGVNMEMSYFIAGGVSDCVASLIYVPSEVLKTRLQLQGAYNNPHSLSAHNYRSTVDALNTIYKKRGIKGLYNGWGATLLRDVPYSALQFTLYETLKTRVDKKLVDTGMKDKSWVGDMLCGGVAGGISGAVTTPLDVVKTYLQTQQRGRHGGAVFVGAAGDWGGRDMGQAYNGVGSALRGVYRTSGICGLFSGVGVRVIWTSSQSCVMFLLYEFFLDNMAFH